MQLLGFVVFLMNVLVNESMMQQAVTPIEAKVGDHHEEEDLPNNSSHCRHWCVDLYQSKVVANRIGEKV